MEQAYQAYETLPGTHVMFGGEFGHPGREAPDSRMILNLKVYPCRAGGSDPTGPEMEISVGITIPQVAGIVLEFFSGLARRPAKNIYRSFLFRMMRRRWALMTTPLAKTPLPGSDWFDRMKYSEIP